MWQSQATPALGGAPFQKKQLNEEHWDHSVVYRMLTPLEMAMESERERERERVREKDRERKQSNKLALIEPALFRHGPQAFGGLQFGFC